MINLRNTHYALCALVVLSSVSTAQAIPAVGLTVNNTLIQFDTDTPNVLTSGPTSIQGLQAGETVLGIDVRPANGLLYGLGSTGRLYTINVLTGTATLVAALSADPADATNPFVSLSGSEFGIDFNPVPDRLRVISNTDQNLRINPDTGTVTTDGALAFAVGDANAGQDPTATAAAYTNSFSGATATTLYVLDFNTRTLVIQNPPNNGTLNTLGATLVSDALPICGFDIAPGTNQAFATLTSSSLPTLSFLYTIDLGTGNATVVDKIGPSGTGRVRGLAVYPASIIRLGSATYSVNENAGFISIPVFRIGSTAATAQVAFTTAAGTATPGFDYQETSGTVNFAVGENSKTVLVPIVFNATPEASETFTVTLTSSTSSVATTLALSRTATVTILDSSSANVAPPPTGIYALTSNNQLIFFKSNTPSTVSPAVTITGVQSAEKILAIDFRPANGQLYGLGSSSRLYTIDPTSGAATQVGSAGAFTLSGTTFGFAFNPVVDRIRVVSNTRQNLRLNPNDGTLAGVDTSLNHEDDTDGPGPDTADVNNGMGLVVVAAAYTHPSVATPTLTTLYDIDSQNDSLLIQNPPNSGTTNTVGRIVIDGTAADVPLLTGFDIAPGNIGFASISAAGANKLFLVNLSNGQFTTLGTINFPDSLRSIAVANSTLANLSTRLRVETGDNVLIGGFIVTGTEPKKVVILATGPSLPLADALANPTLELYQGNTLLQSNDNWGDSADKQAIIDSGFAPANSLESAILTTLPANSAYTAIVRGVNNGTGIGVVQVYDLDGSADSKLANISTRGLVQTGDNVLIAGTIVLGHGPKTVIVRAIGPSLSVSGKLQDPTLELRDQNGGLLQANDNWTGSPDSVAIQNSGLAPSDSSESAILATLPAEGSQYTAIIRGVNGTTGVAVIEVYALD